MKTEEANARLAQEAWKHIQKTRKKSIDEDGTCVYSGAGCAFAPALKGEKERKQADSLAQEDNHIHIDCARAGYLIENREELLKEWVHEADRDFANLVQACHDYCDSKEGDDFVEEFRKRLARACESKNVKRPEGV